MTTELVLLLSIFAFVVLGAFVGPGRGPKHAFSTGGPQLAARVEKHLSTGRNFPVRAGNPGPNKYLVPTSSAPSSEF